MRLRDGSESNFGAARKIVAVSMRIGIPFQRVLGSIIVDVAGRIPNWNMQLNTLMVAKNCR